MEANEYDTNNQNSDVLLPPRKRLLAGLKRQSSGSPSQSSPENSSSPSMSEFDIRLQNMLKSYKNGPYMSPKEIAKAAELAAVVASKAAEIARAAAEEKAAFASKAVAAAKNALSLVASFSNKDGQSKKNKMKKRVSVEHLYKDQETVEAYGTDEELARKLHQAINSSPRISKHSPRSKNKHKKPKPSVQYENDGKSTSSDHTREDTYSEGSYEESYVAKVYERASKPNPLAETRIEAESRQSKEKFSESSDGIHTNGRKRGRVKQKKLPLSLCSFKDRVNPKDGNQTNLDPSRSVPDKSAASKHTPVEPTPIWKSQNLKVPYEAK